MSLFRKSRSKSESQQEYQCTIRFLDDSEPIQVPFTKDTLGQLVLDKVCGTLNLMEKDYFGLRYVDAEKQRHWLDPTKTVYRQLKGRTYEATLSPSSKSSSRDTLTGVSPCVLCFRVKFYPADPMKLHEEITRYYLFLQLRRDLHHGRLLCSPQDANLLAAYIIQSEVGDYDPQDHPPGYVAEFKMLPKQNIKMEEQIMDIHKTLVGQVPAEAEANFLKKASTLDTYGVDPHQVKDQKGTQLYLGVTHQGIMTFHGSRRTQMYKWSQIKKLAFEGKMFIAHVNINEDVDSPKKKHQPVGYKCINAAACKYLWRCAVEQQFFFTLADSYNPPKLRSGGSLFSRGSKFRFSGRCQNEAYQASENIKRKEPDFQRTCSLPTFARHAGNKSFDEKARTISQNMPGLREDLSRKRYKENAVDVPGTAEVPQSPVIKAPGSIGDGLMVSETLQAVHVSPVASANFGAIQQNGTIPIIVTPAGDAPSRDTTLPYNPEESVYGADDDAKAAKSLEDQILELEQEFEQRQQQQQQQQPKQQQPNHVQPVTEDTITPVQSKKAETVANHTGKPAVASPEKSSSRCSCCKVLAFTFFFVGLTLTATVCFVMFSDVQHPVVDQVREQIHFLEPVRDYVQHQYNTIFKS